ncbi:2-polyprenyl-6-methoxyphenol hydroxylase-like FAD-dependent oxidoreductase [Microlunatus panaciterrae]|uniref:2-polyprenyl-6-methoxyphenol hydroxylase-like FAD-dependent oxidoreductase n=1 Tax=Microlunatus panaciterrae TaxID=400768 RepID=A0ABS2RGI9_9ACTN|nr:hypothetical protein [Microlunatus panaciterrae]MBM7798115.1 2-polyprenyl-6-methoxyphenol hydroxylase-like FAD-dependent oxidoreductase [Microlunatus panaciterrae]
MGAGIAGLGAALFLARDGHPVTVCEIDGPPPPGIDELWSDWARPNVPHGRLGHGFLSGFCTELQSRAPDVLQGILDAGAVVQDLTEQAPEGKREPGDEQLIIVMCRRPVLEGLLRRAVEAEPSVTIRSGCRLAGVVAEPGRPPTVTGVRTSEGDVIAADVVVMAGGRRLPLMRWLDAIGAERPAEVSEGCGQLWYTRYNRLRPRNGEDGTATLMAASAIQDLGYMYYAFGPGDRGTFCYELGIPVRDRSLRAVHDQSVFMAVIHLMPEAADLLADGRSEPVGRMCPMGEEHNIVRAFPRQGAPLALGLHVIGDARSRTNSLYAWGVSLALQQAAALTDAIREHPTDNAAQAWELEAAVADEIEGRYLVSMSDDRAWLRAMGVDRPRVTDRRIRVIDEVLRPASKVDRRVWRELTRWNMCLRSTRSLADDDQLIRHAEALRAGRQSPAKAAKDTPDRGTVLGTISRSGPETRA